MCERFDVYNDTFFFLRHYKHVLSIEYPLPIVPNLRIVKPRLRHIDVKHRSTSGINVLTGLVPPARVGEAVVYRTAIEEYDVTGIQGRTEGTKLEHIPSDRCDVVGIVGRVMCHIARIVIVGQEHGRDAQFVTAVNEGGTAHRCVSGEYPIVVEFVHEAILRAWVIHDVITGREDVHVMTREAIDMLEQMGRVGVYRLIARSWTAEYGTDLTQTEGLGRAVRSVAPEVPSTEVTPVEGIVPRVERRPYYGQYGRV